MFSYIVVFEMPDGQTLTRAIEADGDWSACLVALGVQTLLGAVEFQVAWDSIGAG